MSAPQVIVSWTPGSSESKMGFVCVALLRRAFKVACAYGRSKAFSYLSSTFQPSRQLTRSSPDKIAFARQPPGNLDPSDLAFNVSCLGIFGGCCFAVGGFGMRTRGTSTDDIVSKSDGSGGASEAILGILGLEGETSSDAPRFVREGMRKP